MLTSHHHISAKRLHPSSDLISHVEEIVNFIPPATHDVRAITILERFLKDESLFCLPVLKNRNVCGLINRHRFIENHMVGKYGLDHSLNYYKSVEHLLEPGFLSVDKRTTVESLVKAVQSRDQLKLYDDVCVTDEEEYIGVVSVNNLLNAIMENNLTLAIGANPLSGLPGNDFIQRKIRELLAEGLTFDVCYLDLDNFKPFNDSYSFARGDEVLKAVAEIMSSELNQTDTGSYDFAGHIGGDDFILVTSPSASIPVCESIIKKFNGRLNDFHGEDVYQCGCYESVNRQGEREMFPLLSLSIAVVSNERHPNRTYAELSSVATSLKKKAKLQPGSIVIRDQRK